MFLYKKSYLVFLTFKIPVKYTQLAWKVCPTHTACATKLVTKSLHLPQVTLPFYKRQANENLNRFTNTLTSLLKLSCIPSRFWTILIARMILFIELKKNTCICLEKSTKMLLKEP